MWDSPNAINHHQVITIHGCYVPNGSCWWHWVSNISVKFNHHPKNDGKQHILFEYGIVCVGPVPNKISPIAGTPWNRPTRSGPEKCYDRNDRLLFHRSFLLFFGVESCGIPPSVSNVPMVPKPSWQTEIHPPAAFRKVLMNLENSCKSKCWSWMTAMALGLA